MNLASVLWMLYARKYYKAFCRGAADIEKHQQRILEDIFKANVNTGFGKQHGFREISGYKDFADRVPVSDYESLEPYIEEQITGEKALFNEQVAFVETTSGSTSQPKLIPYNSSLKKVFSRMANTWMYALGKKYKSLWNGSSYWSLSPPMKAAGGTENIRDDDYLSGFTRMLVTRIMAVPPQLAQEQDPLRFYDKTWVCLLSQKRLVFFSVWSPSFLIRLLRHLHQRKAGILRESADLPKFKKIRLQKRLKSAGEKPFLAELFPECKIISCWCDAQAQVHLDELKQLLGSGIAIQPKGLLSTEGVVSFPIDDSDPVLAYNAHFYEFRNLESGLIKCAHELQVGSSYEVIITTQAGLYRYNSRDVVKVTGFWKGVPRLRFVGRSNLLGDFVGEKLSWQQALAVFEFLQKQAVQPYAFTWKDNEGLAGYSILAGGSASASVLEKANSMLCENPYFAQAQKLKQMDIVRIEEISAEAISVVSERMRRSRNISEGDFKNPLFVDYEFLER